MRQNDPLNEIQRLRLVAVVLQISAESESIRKLNFREALSFPCISTALGEFIFHGDTKKGSDGSFFIYSKDWNVFCPFLFHYI